MAIPPPENEQHRLAALRALRILDTPPESAFDDLAALAAQICAAPIALIGFIDDCRLWIKSRIGWTPTEIPRHSSFCQEIIGQKELLIVPDATTDPRFASLPLVTEAPAVRFYAGAPLVLSNGAIAGAICVLDYAPRVLTEAQAGALAILSRQVVQQLEFARRVEAGGAAQLEREAALAQKEREMRDCAAALAESRRQAQTRRVLAEQIMDRIGDGVIGLNAAFLVSYINRQASLILGRAAEELIGSSIWQHWPDASGAAVGEECRRASQQNCVIHLHRQLHWEDRFFDLRIYPLADGVSIILQDVTVLEKERGMLESIIQGLPGIFYLFDQHGRFLRWSERTLRQSGYTAEEYQRSNPLDLVAEEDREAVAEAIKQVFTSGHVTIEGRLLTKDGRKEWNLFSGQRITYNDVTCLVGLGVDISMRKAAEAALRDAQIRLELSIQASRIGLWDWELATDHIAFSPEWKSMLGYAPHEIPDETSLIPRLMHPDDLPKVRTEIAAYIENPIGDFHAEIRMLHRDGSYRWIHSQGRIYPDPSGRPWRMMGCHIDVTKRREMEEDLRGLAAHLQTAREEEGERISRELHDELGASLTGIKLDLAWLERRLVKMLAAESFALIHERLKTIGETIDATVQSVRKVCRDLRPAVLGQLGLAPAIDWLAAEFESRTGLNCQVSLPDVLEVDSDKATAVFRIIQELLTNVARHAMASEVRIDVSLGEGELILEVNDNGRGLPDNALSRSDRFGIMGLRERVLAAGGSVEFQSSKGRGTRVLVQIPV